MWAIKNELKKTLNTLKKNKVDFNRMLMEIQENATLRAIEKATDMTPPTEDMDNGTGTITGRLKSAWSQDSIKKAYKKNKLWVTELKNSVEYASYVNDGHRMDKHFVPGLIINPFSGKIEKAPDGMNTGIMVGTKTKYVNGIFMKEAAIKEYEQAVKRQIDKLLKDVENGKFGV